MPIYAYRCSSCGHAQDVLQRMSDPLLTTCPACGAETYAKQLTAAGFQLKGSGWYVTDFREGNKVAAKADEKPDGKAEGQGDTKSDAPAAPATDPKAVAKPADSPAASPAPAPAAPAPAPSPTTGG